MKIRKLKLISIIGLILMQFTILWSCQDESDNKMSSEQVKTQTTLAAKDNAEIIAATQDALELTAGVFQDEGLSNGRASTSGRINGEHHHGNKYGCKPNIIGTYSLDNRHKDSLIYSGSITIDFGDGSTCTDSTHIRKGKMTNAFTFILSFKDSITYSTTQTLTFEGFAKDSVTLDGVFTTKASSGNPVTVEAKNAQITYPDGTSSSWNGILTYTYAFRDSCEWKDNTVSVTGAISGTNRAGFSFTATITEPIVYKYSCEGSRHFIPVSGTIEISVGGFVSTVNYGDGTCNKVYTITIGGVTTEYEFKYHH